MAHGSYALGRYHSVIAIFTVYLSHVVQLKACECAFLQFVFVSVIVWTNTRDLSAKARAHIEHQFYRLCHTQALQTHEMNISVNTLFGHGNDSEEVQWSKRLNHWIKREVAFLRNFTAPEQLGRSNENGRNFRKCTCTRASAHDRCRRAPSKLKTALWLSAHSCVALSRSIDAFRIDHTHKPWATPQNRYLKCRLSFA